jgi:hypothetical protein
MSQRILHLLSLIVGFVGLCACIAAIIAIWFINARLIVGAEKLFAVIDDTLVQVQQRADQAQDQVQSLKITTSDIGRNVKEWTQAEASGRLASQIAIGEKAERLASGLQQADQWLEVAESSVQVVQKAFEVAGSIGLHVRSDRPDRLLKEVGSLRNRLADALEPVENIRQRATEVRDEGLPLQRLEPIMDLALRVIATLSSVDAQIETFQGQLLEMQTKAQDAKAVALRSIRIAAIVTSLLFGWMAAGQYSLCYLGWRGLRRG